MPGVSGTLPVADVMAPAERSVTNTPASKSRHSQTQPFLLGRDGAVARVDWTLEQ